MLEGLTFGGLIFGREFVLVSRGVIFGELICRGLIFEILRYDVVKSALNTMISVEKKQYKDIDNYDIVYVSNITIFFR